jgi:hypothetical protein
VATGGEHVASRKVRGRLAQVHKAQASAAALAERDGGLVDPLFSAGMAKHDLSFRDAAVFCDCTPLASFARAVLT